MIIHRLQIYKKFLYGSTMYLYGADAYCGFSLELNLYRFLVGYDDVHDYKIVHYENN